jgi:poly(3-hydroxybutyrate) depolymerase
MTPETRLMSPFETVAPSATMAALAFGGGLEAWRAACDGLQQYWEGVWRRGSGPLDVASDLTRWWNATAIRSAPEWATPNQVVLESPLARLRDFSAGGEDALVPTLLVPPQAGHDSCIVDYSAEQSQVKTALAAGLTRLYSLDWAGATEQTKDAAIVDYLEFMDRAIERIGEPVNLIGDCQGGWLAVIYAALRPESVHTLTIAGAPVDFHAGEAVIHDFVQALSPGDLSFYQDVVRLGGGVMKGEFMLNGFIAIKPESEVAKQFQLLANIDDADHVLRHRAFEDWFKHTQDIPGALYLWIVEHLFRDNALIRGELAVAGERVDLRRIRCPLNLLAGASDHITPPPQVFALEGAVSTPREDVTRRVTGGGHLGLFMGREALRDHWPPIVADIFRRSQPTRGAASARRRATAASPPARKPVPAP